MNEARTSADATDPRARFIKAAVWHGSLDEAQALLTAHPEIAESDIHTAALLGNDALVRDFILRDPASATTKSPPLSWDALTHLCFSKYLRLDRSRSDAFVAAAQALLDAGASASTGFFDERHQPQPEWESVLYGAAGVAHHAGLTRLLLVHGADPNDAEVPYHAPETFDNAALDVLLESGKLNADSLATMLVRKVDWHDYQGLERLLDHGADPNRMTFWPMSALHQAVRRDNALENIRLLIDRGGDALLTSRLDRLSAAALAAWRGRADVLELLQTRDVSVSFEPIERLLAACAKGDAVAARDLARAEPAVVDAIRSHGGTVLAQFAGVGNTEGLACLLDLGIEVDARFIEGDGYFGIAPDSTALHVAAWRAHPATVNLLVARGANVNAIDGRRRTPLMLAVLASVDSYWTERRTPESVDTLLRAGASIDGVMFPSGYDEVDRLIAVARRH